MKNHLKTGLLMLAFFSILAAKAQVPKLNSLPSATATLFLDFDGHTVVGTGWNYNGPIVCEAATLDNDQITTIFNRVAEDYRPFKINITTDSTKFLAAPAASRMRVIVTISSSWYGSAGGVAFVESFTWGDDTPCFVFSTLLGNSVKKVSEAISHEAGHTLGLYHQSSYDANCNKLSDYHYGTGSGEIGWAPIMGVGYSQNLTLWNNGPNSFGCTSMQSDLDLITTLNGFTYRTDDHAATFAGATLAPFTSNQFNISGIVERNTDQDMIKFIQPANGRFQLSAIPYNVGTGNSGSDLDLQVTLFNSSQTQLNMYNPGQLLNSVVDTILNAGTYYLKIEGKGNIYAPNYASLGSYALQGNFNTNVTLPLRKLELNGQLNSGKHQFSWIIDADEQVIEQQLEVSTDGRTYTSVTQPAVTARSYFYTPNYSTTVVYRMKVTFDDGHYYYSNVITIPTIGNGAKPRLAGNIITNNNIMAISPGVFDYEVYDMNGKTIRKGKLTSGSNNINVNAVNKGMYVIRFAAANEQWIEKLILQ